MSDSCSSILYDHYKDTFSHIRQRESQRDRWFLLVILLLAAHVLLLRYASAVPELGASVSLFGLSVDVQRVPLPAVLSLSWTMLSAITLRYYQVTVQIDKQYDYLHELEERLSTQLGEPGLIAREGRAYLAGRGKAFRHVAWIFYLAVVPAGIIAACIAAGVVEWQQDAIPLLHKLYDSVVGLLVTVIVSMFVVEAWWRRTAKAHQ